MTPTQKVLACLVGIWLLAFSLLSFYFTAVFWGPAIEFTQFEGNQKEQIEEARESAEELDDELAAVGEASQQIEEAQTSVEAGAGVEGALAEASLAIESVEDVLSELPDGEASSAVVAAEEALDQAQQQISEVTAGGAGQDPPSDEVAEAVEAVEDAVDQAQAAVEQSAIEEVRDVVDDAPEPTIRILWLFDWQPSSELLQLFLAMSGAGVGTSTGALSAITTLIGTRRFKPSWLAWHAARPFWSVGAAVIGYAAIRGGLLNINNSAAALNPFAVFAIGAILGMNASDSLKTLGRILKPGSEPQSDDPNRGEPDRDAAPSPSSVS